jgi:hypothetical protein
MMDNKDGKGKWFLSNG